jgi:hypothetical protein
MPDPAAVCAALGLGTPLAPPAPLPGGSSAGAWRLVTDRGAWAVKTVAPPPDWERHAMAVSGELEAAAFAAGVPMAEPVRPPGDALGLWAALPGGGRARACAWVDGGPPGAGAPLPAWAGRVLAAIEALDLPGDPAALAAGLGAYRDAGGAGGPAAPEAFAGLLRGTLGSLAYSVWLAAGHRTATPARRALAAADVRAARPRLAAMLSSVDDWARLLR